MNSNQTLAGIAKLARGLGGGKVEVKKGGGGRGRSRGKEEATVDLERVCGGPLKDLSNEVSCVRRIISLAFGQTD
jgi:hypothetical protein